MRGSVRGAVRSSERFRFARTFWTQVSPCTKDPRIRNARIRNSDLPMSGLLLNFFDQFSLKGGERDQRSHISLYFVAFPLHFLVFRTDPITQTGRS